MRFLVLVLSLVLVLGCAGKREYLAFEKRNGLETGLCEPLRKEYLCAIGVGRSPEEAERRAKEELAGRVMSVVWVEFRIEKRVKQVTEKEEVREKVRQVKEFVSTNLAYLESEGIEIFREGKVLDGYYYAAVRMRREEAEASRKRFSKKVDLLMYITLLESAEDLDLRIRLLRRLWEIAHGRNLFDEKVVVRNSLTTVGAFISREEEFVRSRLEVVYTGDQVYLIDSVSLKPVPSLSILLVDGGGGRREAVTSSDGGVYLGTTAEPIELYAEIGGKRMLIDTLSKKRISEVYLRTDPEGLRYEIRRGSTIISAGRTPNRISLSPSEDEVYTLRIFGEKIYGYLEEELRIEPGYDLYVLKKLGRARTEEVHLRTEGDAILTLKTLDGRIVVDGERSFRGRLAEGMYLVTIRRKKDSEKYQLLEDSFFLREGEPIRRRYSEPEDRHPFKEGWGGYIASYFFQVPKEAKFEVAQGPKDRRKWNIEGLVFGFRRYMTYLYMGAGMGLASLSPKEATNSGSSLEGVLLDAVAGVYRDFVGGGGVVELGVGYAIGKVNAVPSSNSYENYDATTEFSLPFISIRVSMIFGLEVRIFRDRTIALSLQLGLSGIRSGFRYPRKVIAKRGEHYEEF